jgi:hypothetical protein
MKALGTKTDAMAMDLNVGQMAPATLVTTDLVRNMAKALLSSVISQNTSVTLTAIEFMEPGSTPGQTAAYTQASGQTTR